jgi:Na+-translocating ferredoxin:NAD+ oxidoreductase RnfC subunit
MNISEVIKDRGVVGAGGAGFPTHVKVRAEADTVIVNGAECEPLLAGDKFLMETAGEKVVKGLEYIMEACKAEKGFIALKKKYLSIFSDMVKAAVEKDNIEIFPMDDFYPAGDEFILVQEVTGRLVPEGGIPPQVGCIVDNVETVVNIFNAVTDNKPVTKRFLTCAGEVKTPSIIEACIGTPISEIIRTCGGATVDNIAVLTGGPFMGSLETDLESPVTKTMSGVIVLPDDHPAVRKRTIPFEFMVKQSKSACCQCTYCTELCPRHLLGHGLEPHMIMRQISYGIDVPSKAIENAFLCSECGLCGVYACVMELSPDVINRKIKEKFSKNRFKPDFPLRDIAVSELKDYRRVPAGRVLERLGLAKYASVNLKRGVLDDPGRVEIPLKQHTGVPSTPVVKPGEDVSLGMLIADIPAGELGAKIHSSIDGRVTLVDVERIVISSLDRN